MTSLFKLFLSFYIVFIDWNSVQAQNQIDAIARRDPRYYTNYKVLDRDHKYILEWTVNWQDNSILFNVTVETKGYIAFGLSAKGELAGADVVIGGVGRNGKSYFLDTYGDENGKLRVDLDQNWQLHSANEDESQTCLSFSRKFDTCDEQDFAINELDTTTVIFGYGKMDNPLWMYPSEIENRGILPLYLLDPNVIPRSIKEEAYLPGPPSSKVLYSENIRLWTTTTRHKIAPTHTDYFCTIHKGPKLQSRKHHIVGVRVESKLAIKHTHHVLFYRCLPPQNESAYDLFEQYLNGPGQQCYFLGRPTGPIPTQYCTEVKVVWAIGGTTYFYPDHLGMSIGDSGPDEYFLMQTHYDNPDMREDIEYTFNMDIFYTDKLRPNEVGIMTVGHHIPGSPSILLPPQTEIHQIYGHCGSDCTNHIFPPEGIKVSVVMMHTHYSGRKQRVRHFRGNRELPWIIADRNYVNSFQEYRILKNEVRIMPGDHLVIQTEYDNTWMNGSVVGGFSTVNEMGLIYMMYYNKLEFGLCRSEITSPSYWRKYLGVNNITWSNEKLEFVATSPPSLAEMSMSEISDSRVRWDTRQRRQLQDDHRNHVQTNTCSRSPFSTTGGGSVSIVEPDPTYMVSFPSFCREYVPPSSTCGRVSDPVKERSGWTRGLVQGLQGKPEKE